MTDGLTVAALLLVVGPVVPGVALSNPALFRVWFAPREEHLALVRAHRRGWAAINAGFTIATVVTSAGLAVLAGNVDAADGPRAVVTSAVVAYAIAGSLWCALLAIRTRTTPALAEMVVAGTPTEPAETLLGAALGGLFAAFILATSAALVVLGVTFAASGLIATPVAWLTALIPAVVIASFFRSGDAVPAVLYLPTMLVGVALLLGWT
jgi:phosphoglycerol transferase MdoB-like AlkP superfamily enzyme